MVVRTGLCSVEKKNMWKTNNGQTISTFIKPVLVCVEEQRKVEEKKDTIGCVKLFVTHLFVTQAVNISRHLSEKAKDGYLSA